MNLKTIVDLKRILENPKDLIKGDSLDMDACKKLAKALVTEFWIRKGSQHYWITDLEFYIYTDSHRDIITYPRNCEAGCWFFHDSGVDITFKSNVEFAKDLKSKKSKPKLTKDSVFGGILLRGIDPVEPLNLPDGAILKLDGPHKLCDHLFDQFNALAADDSFPLLEPSGETRTIVLPDPVAREGFTDQVDKKAKTIHSNYSECYLDLKQIRTAYLDFFGAEYHYTLYSK